MWIGPDALLLVDVETSMKSPHVRKGDQEMNYRITDPNFWWATNEPHSSNFKPEAVGNQRRAMAELFGNVRHPSLRLLVRMHVVITANTHAECFNPDEDVLRTLDFHWEQLADGEMKSQLIEINIDQRRLTKISLDEDWAFLSI
jgi:acetyl-CoA acetyltransferase